MSIKKFWLTPTHYGGHSGEHLNAHYITFRVGSSQWAVARRLSSRGLEPHSLIWLPTGAAIRIHEDRWRVTTMRTIAAELAKGDWTPRQLQELGAEAWSLIRIGTWKGDRNQA